MAKLVLEDDVKKLSTRIHKNIRTQIEEICLENLSRYYEAIINESRIEDVVEPGCSTDKDPIPKKYEFPLVGYGKYFTIDCLTDGKLTWDSLHKVIEHADEAAFNAREAARNCRDTLSFVEETVNHCRKRLRTAERKVNRATDLRDSSNFGNIGSKYQRALNLIVENASKADLPEKSARLIAKTTAVVTDDMFQNVEYNISKLTPDAINFVVLETMNSNESAIDAKKAEWLVLKAMKKGWEVPDPELSEDPVNPDDERNQSDCIYNGKWMSIAIGIFSALSIIMYILLRVLNLDEYSLPTILATGVLSVIMTVFISTVKIYLHFSEKWRLAEITRTVIRKNEMLAFIDTRIGELNEYFVNKKITLEEHERGDWSDEDENRLTERQDA